MEFICLIYNDEQRAEVYAPEAMPQYAAFSQEVADKGVMRDGAPLQPIATATTVRVRDRKTQTSDGPFAETKEQLGGFYLLDCKDIDEALAYAEKIPGAKYGSIEVRPIWAM